MSTTVPLKEMVLLLEFVTASNTPGSYKISKQKDLKVISIKNVIVVSLSYKANANTQMMAI